MVTAANMIVSTTFCLILLLETVRSQCNPCPTDCTGATPEPYTCNEQALGGATCVPYSDQCSVCVRCCQLATQLPLSADAIYTSASCGLGSCPTPAPIVAGQPTTPPTPAPTHVCDPYDCVAGCTGQPAANHYCTDGSTGCQNFADECSACCYADGISQNQFGGAVATATVYDSICSQGNCPTLDPTATPSRAPSKSPSTDPTASPSSNPSQTPSQSPSGSPSEQPSQSPSGTPSQAPTQSPSTDPSQSPSGSPSEQPTQSPSGSPSKSPTTSPTPQPTRSPLLPGQTHSPSAQPTDHPSGSPSKSPSASPSKSPSGSPTVSPSESPSGGPSQAPTQSPEAGVETSNPSMPPSEAPVEGTDAPTTAKTAGANMVSARIAATFLTIVVVCWF
mmetsp:Transcript_46327/g.74285  ORF Transcript_46327/g.74285 Transcript_46327/m.74285 type:complete len:391 (-) Transcript_46327:133-1305(-)